MAHTNFVCAVKLLEVKALIITTNSISVARSTVWDLTKAAPEFMIIFSPHNKSRVHRIGATVCTHVYALLQGEFLVGTVHTKIKYFANKFVIFTFALKLPDMVALPLLKIKALITVHRLCTAVTRSTVLLFTKAAPEIFSLFVIHNKSFILRIGATTCTCVF